MAHEVSSPTCSGRPYAEFLVDRFGGYGVLTPQNCHFPLTCCVALTTV